MALFFFVSSSVAGCVRCLVEEREGEDEEDRGMEGEAGNCVGEGEELWLLLLGV